MTTKRYALTALLACGLSGYASASTVFSANFEDGGTDADVGTLIINNNAPTFTNVGTSATDATLGDNVLLVDQTSIDAQVDFELGFTDALSLTGSNTVDFSFNVAARRTNGFARTHFVTGFDSNGDEVFQLILGDSNAFGNGGGDRQRPGFGTADGADADAIDERSVLPDPDNPNSFFWGSDTSPAEFNVNVDASFALSISNDGWDLTTTGAFAGTYNTPAELPLFNGGTAEDLARITIVSAGGVAGNYYDNFLVEGTLVPEPSSLALLGLGGLLIARRRR